MRRFQIIILETNIVRLVETHTDCGVCKDFEGRSAMSDALRFMGRLVSPEHRVFKIISGLEACK